MVPLSPEFRSMSSQEDLLLYIDSKEDPDGEKAVKLGERLEQEFQKGKLVVIELHGREFGEVLPCLLTRFGPYRGLKELEYLVHTQELLMADA